MKCIEAALRRLGRKLLGLPEVDITQTDLNNAFQLGFQNGKACGELGGRNGVILEMELILAAKGKVLNDAEAEDVQAAKLRTVH